MILEPGHPHWLYPAEEPEPATQATLTTPFKDGGLGGVPSPQSLPLPAPPPPPHQVPQPNPPGQFGSRPAEVWGHPSLPRPLLLSALLSREGPSSRTTWMPQTPTWMTCRPGRLASASTWTPAPCWICSAPRWRAQQEPAWPGQQPGPQALQAPGSVAASNLPVHFEIKEGSYFRRAP